MRKLVSPPIVLVVFIFLAALFLYYFFSPSSSSPQAGRAEKLQQNEAPETPPSETVTPQSQSADNSLAPAPPTVQELKTWIASEAKKMNEPHVDTKQKDSELKQKVENFSGAEKKEVLELAHDTNSGANDRILAAYMLVLDQSQESLGNLEMLAQKKLPDFGPITAHSEAEIRRGQELAVRYMAIDELVKRAGTDPQAIETLKKLAASAESDEVKHYAERALTGLTK